jgi:signal transduction histidine kinase/DNA-binding response OmpR family regulator
MTSNPPSAPKDILIAEDSPTQARRLQHILERQGYQVTIATNGVEALESALKNKPDVVISDVVMPEMDGYELCQRIKATPGLKEIPVILVTTLSDPHDVIKGLECRADNFILKPYDERHLLSRVQFVFVNSEMRQSDQPGMGLEIFFNGQRHFITADRLQILNLLLSTYEAAMQRNRELTITQDELQRTNSDLQILSEELEERVAHRTVALKSQFERLSLLQQITRAISNRHDLRSIFQVVIRSLEDQLPVDFSCVCLYDEGNQLLKINSVGMNSAPLAMELAMTEDAYINIDQSGLSGCLRGELVYEPNLATVDSPFTQRLYRGGLQAFVAAPLQVERHVFGIVIVARRESNSFGESECEFLRQLSEHVALAANEAQLHKSLQQAYDDLRNTQQFVMQQERLRALGQMASGVAHDINNALSPVALYTEALLEKEHNLSERGRGYLETIQRAIEDVAETISRMREFYREREPQVHLVPVLIEDLINQVVDLTRARWRDMPQQQGIVIQMVTELAPNSPLIMGVESELREALINLIFNAVDAMPDGGTITLRTKVAAAIQGSDTRQLVLEVVDTGVGMDEDTRRRCLEPFFTSKGERGTGLGLAMVYGMAERHNAQIEVESEVGKGSCVRISFSMPREPEFPLVKPTEEPSVPANLRILVIDDDPLVLNSIRDTLLADGHDVVAANGGQDGIDVFNEGMANSEPFSLVITDLGMPYVDGGRVSSAVKSASPSTPVILFTGWGQRLVESGETPLHVDRVLSKPPRLRDLREALAELCTFESTR